MNNQIKLIRKAIQMEIIKPQIQLTITKSELNQLITEALADPTTAATIKRALTPLLANSFPQFPGFTNITIGDTDESGATEVTLRQPRETKSSTVTTTEETPVDTEPTGPIKSIEPPVIDEASIDDSIY